MSRRRLLVLTPVVLALVMLLAPLWSGYFGPTAVAYVTSWRPWRSHVTVHLDRTFTRWPQRATLVATYTDPWPGEARTPGPQTDFVTVERLNALLPWIVCERGSGP